MFIIKSFDGIYFYNEGKIILFVSQEEATYFLNLFTEYSMQRLAQEERMHDVMQVIAFLSQCQIAPIDFDTNKIQCGTILASELLDKVR